MTIKTSTKATLATKIDALTTSLDSAITDKLDTARKAESTYVQDTTVNADYRAIMLACDTNAKYLARVNSMTEKAMKYLVSNFSFNMSFSIVS